MTQNPVRSCREGWQLGPPTIRSRLERFQAASRATVPLFQRGVAYYARQGGAPHSSSKAKHSPAPTCTCDATSWLCRVRLGSADTIFCHALSRPVALYTRLACRCSLSDPTLSRVPAPIIDLPVFCCVVIVYPRCRPAALSTWRSGQR